MENEKRTLKVGIIGLGDVSPIHIQAIEMSEHAELTAVCDIDPTLTSMVESTPFYRDYTEMISKHKLDVVHNCLPHHLHYPVTKGCVEAGVHVFLEKPVSISFEEGILQKNLEDESGQKICVCFQNRYNATFIKLQDVLSKGETGAITGIKALVTWYREDNYYQSKPWRRTKKEVGYGNIMSQSIHTLDLVQLLGGKVAAVKSTLSKLLDVDSEVEDTASAVFTFASGSRGYFHATNANVDNSSVELQVNTDQATYIIRDSTLYQMTSEGEQEKLAVDEKLEGVKFYFGASHKLLIDRFYNAVLEDTDDYVSVADALPSIQLIEMMAASSRTVTEPVTISPELFKS
ncbi:MAG: Gfo/Idh/MocA family oxidoreductase [Alkalibacterium sp.]|nr:Gfo/Idh/MocA family oxidoreductase [Alkalibacterium sp.]